MQEKRYGDVHLLDLGDHVSLVEIRRGPHNFFDTALIASLADAFEALDRDPAHRVAVLAAEGENFCAGAAFSTPATPGASTTGDNEIFVDAGQNPLYAQAVRLFATRKHVIAAVQGAAIGGGFGLALFADFRVGAPETRFAANFVKLGITPGFGLTHTLPSVVGQQAAFDLFYTGRRVGGEEARRIGLLDRLARAEELRNEAIGLARSIAENAPLALLDLRAAMRGGLADAVLNATRRENASQARLVKTADHVEGVRAVAERRRGEFKGR